MNYLTLFSPHNLALLSDWLQETGELYVDVYQVHSGGPSSAYFIHSMNDFRSLIAEQTWRELAVRVFRQVQYPLRGIANPDLLQQALSLIPDGEWYTIVSLELSQFPSMIAWWGQGRSHKEFRREFAEVIGEKIGIGQEPFDIRDADWFRAHTDEVFTTSYTYHNQFKIVKNQDYYEPYAQNPAKYQWLIDLWHSE